MQIGQNRVLVHDNGTSDFKIEMHNLDSKCLHCDAGGNWHNDNRSCDNILQPEANM